MTLPATAARSSWRCHGASNRFASRVPGLSDVVNHKVDKFTIDALVSMLARIGKQVRFAVQ